MEKRTNEKAFAALSPASRAMVEENYYDAQPTIPNIYTQDIHTRHIHKGMTHAVFSRTKFRSIVIVEAKICCEKSVTRRKNMATAEEVRRYAFKQIQLARQRGEKTISFTALEIHKGMGLNQCFPLVCSAIDTIDAGFGPRQTKPPV